MNKKVSVSSMLLIVSLSVCITYMIGFTNAANQHKKSINEMINSSESFGKLISLDSEIRKIYIGDIDDEKLMDSIMDGYMRGIGDKYAEYMSKSRYAEFQLENKGHMVGIGVRVIYDNLRGVIEVISIIPDSPAEKGGLLTGDLIYRVGEEYISELGYYAAVDKIKGEKGSSVEITILRDENGVTAEKTMSFIRDDVTMETVTSKLLDSNVGYIRILEFNKETPREFTSAVNKLEGEGAEKYVFDVRYNPGGDLDGIKETLDFLLPEGPIIKIFYKNGAVDEKRSDSNEFDAPMIVLINESTASAAELFAAALRDYEKATLIGKTTYGKGTVQTIFGLGDGSGIRVSQAMYNPPFGENYDGVGVAPDVEIDLDQELLKEKNFNKITVEEDAQLTAAIDFFKTAS